MHSETGQERIATRMIAGILGVVTLAGGILVVVVDRTLWQVWVSTLIMGPVLLYTAFVGSAPGLPGRHAVQVDQARVQERAAQPLAWWKRLGIGVFAGTLLGTVEMLFSGSWRDGLLGWALPFGALVGIALLLAPLIGRSRVRLVLVGIIAGSAAGLLSWAFVHRGAGMTLWWPVAIGSFVGIAVVWTELKGAVPT